MVTMIVSQFDNWCWKKIAILELLLAAAWQRAKKTPVRAPYNAKCSVQNRYDRDAVREVAGGKGGMVYPSPVFGRSVNPNTTRRRRLSHQITTTPPPS